MSLFNKKTLIVHSGHTLYWAEEIKKGLLQAANIEAVTLKSVLLNGEPLNIKKLVDETAGVILLEDKSTNGDIVAYAIASYAKELGKLKPVSIGDTEIGFNVDYKSLGIITFSPKQSDIFWSSLVGFIKLKCLR